MGSRDDRPLRLLSFLAPSLPEGLFRLVGERIAAATRRSVELDFETTVSGPTLETDPFASGRADLAFVCGPSYAVLRAGGAPVAFIPAAPVFDDPRNGGRPVYFADVIVPAAHPCRRLADLCGGRWVYNDRESLSGWHRMIERLAAAGLGEPESFYARVFASGAHVRSIEMVASGEADVSAVDSNALILAWRRTPALSGRLRVLESWGPTPIQPLLASAALDERTRAEVLSALLTLDGDAAARRALAGYGVLRFAPADPASYEGLIAVS
ncbi:MAG TPA: PhnD/SsuA/transferrin family substrate-binding protein [Thermoanaerobaculia bacterium]|nr:PhnD/SsuA/transferrin family substrate-binding protein [Thermoanaerobaculia bacterium]